MTVKAAPRGPRGHLLLGSGPDLARDQLGFYAACARDYGDVVPLRLGPNRGLLVYHPDAIEEVLVTRSRDFIKSPGVRLLARAARQRAPALRGRTSGCASGGSSSPRSIGSASLRTAR